MFSSVHGAQPLSPARQQPAAASAPQWGWDDLKFSGGDTLNPGRRDRCHGTVSVGMPAGQVASNAHALKVVWQTREPAAASNPFVLRQMPGQKEQPRNEAADRVISEMKMVLCNERMRRCCSDDRQRGGRGDGGRWAGDAAAAGARVAACRAAPSRGRRAPSHPRPQRAARPRFHEFPPAPQGCGRPPPAAARRISVLLSVLPVAVPIIAPFLCVISSGIEELYKRVAASLEPTKLHLRRCRTVNGQDEVRCTTVTG